MFVPSKPLFYVTVTVPVYHHSTDGLIGSRTYRESAHLTLDDAYGQFVLNIQEESASFGDEGASEVYFGIEYKGKRMPTPSRVLAEQGPYYCPFNGERTFQSADGVEQHATDCYAPF